MAKSQRGRDKVEKLRRAVFRRNWDKAEAIIRQIPEGRLLPTIHVDQEQWSVLHVAAMVNAPAPLVEKMLNVVDVNFCMKKDANGNNPLHRICRTGTDIETIRLMAMACPRAFHESNTEEEKTPFDVILCQEHFSPDEISLLITEVAATWPDGMHSTNHCQENLLHRAIPYCMRHGPDVARAILGTVSDIMERPNENGATPMHYAARHKGLYATELIELLVNHNVDCALDLCDSAGRMPLHDACSSGTIKPDVIQFLVAKYPDALKITDENGMTPLAVFRRRYRRHHIHYLSRQMAIAEAAMTLIVGEPVRCSDSPSIHSFLRNENCTCDIMRFIAIVLSNQASDKDENGDVPLHFVCSMRNADPTYYCEVVEILLKANPAACRIPNHDGSLPLELMAHSGKTWSNGMRLVFLEHPAAVLDLGLNSHALCALLGTLVEEPTLDAMFRLLKDAPNLLQTS